MYVFKQIEEIMGMEKDNIAFKWNPITTQDGVFNYTKKRSHDNGSTSYHYYQDSKYLLGGKNTSVVVQWLRLHAPNAGVPGSIPGQGT